MKTDSRTSGKGLFRFLIGLSSGTAANLIFVFLVTPFFWSPAYGDGNATWSDRFVYLLLVPFPFASVGAVLFGSLALFIPLLLFMEMLNALLKLSRNVSGPIVVTLVFVLAFIAGILASKEAGFPSNLSSLYLSGVVSLSVLVWSLRLPRQDIP